MPGLIGHDREGRAGTKPRMNLYLGCLLSCISHL